jgi:hypothetical protein
LAFSDVGLHTILTIAGSHAGFTLSAELFIAGALFETDSMLQRRAEGITAAAFDTDCRGAARTIIFDLWEAIGDLGSSDTSLDAIETNGAVARTLAAFQTATISTGATTIEVFSTHPMLTAGFSSAGPKVSTDLKCLIGTDLATTTAPLAFRTIGAAIADFLTDATVVRAVLDAASTVSTMLSHSTASKQGHGRGADIAFFRSIFEQGHRSAAFVFGTGGVFERTALATDPKATEEGRGAESALFTTILSRRCQRRIAGFTCLALTFGGRGFSVAETVGSREAAFFQSHIWTRWRL